MTAGIAAIGSYVPRERLALSEVKSYWPSSGAAGGPNSVAVAGSDEDVITMAVEAVHTLLSHVSTPVEDIDLLIMATCSSPYAEHSAAGEVARAIGLPRSAAFVDQSGSTLCGVGALIAAVDAVNAGRSQHALVIASDRRRGKPGAATELFGAGAIAVLISENGRVVVNDAASWRCGVPTRWRPDGQASLHHYEDARYEMEHQILPAIRGLLDQLTVDPPAFGAIAPVDSRALKAVARAFTFHTQLEVGEIAEVGDLGCAAPLFLLAVSLAGRPEPGAHGICVAVEPGSGAQGFVVTASATPAIIALRPHPVSINYVEYLQRFGILTGIAPTEPIVPYAATPGASRDDTDNSLAGARCAECRSLFIPPRALCLDCGSHRFTTERGPRSGTVVTFNVQHVVAVHPEPAPVAVGVIRLEGEGGQRGGQVSAMFCDSDLDSLGIGDDVELVYRRIGVDDGLVKYGWKARRSLCDDERLGTMGS